MTSHLWRCLVQRLQAYERWLPSCAGIICGIFYLWHVYAVTSHLWRVWCSVCRFTSVGSPFVHVLSMARHAVAHQPFVLSSKQKWCTDVKCTDVLMQKWCTDVKCTDVRMQKRCTEQQTKMMASAICTEQQTKRGMVTSCIKHKLRLSSINAVYRASTESIEPQLRVSSLNWEYQAKTESIEH